MFASSGASDELRSFGSLDYWLRLRVPMAETVRLFREKAAAVDHVHSALKPDSKVAAPFLSPYPRLSVLPDLLTPPSPAALPC